jgi:hypothetical protein
VKNTLYFYSMNTENKFEWTDELVLEFERFTNSKTSVFQGRYTDLEQFKKSKQQNAIQKDWEIMEYDYFFYCLNKPLKIKSVKRISDGEVFSLGDEVVFGGYVNFKITSIEISNRYNGVVICNEATEYNINHIEKVKQSLFKTEDGESVYKGGSYYWVNVTYESYWSVICQHEAICDANTAGVKTFSTKEAAQNWVLLNKPVLSVNDIREWLYQFQLDGIEELAKSKIEGK